MTRLFTNYHFSGALCVLASVLTYIKSLNQRGWDRNNLQDFWNLWVSLPLCSCTPVIRTSLKVCTFFSHFCSKVSSHALGFAEAGRCCPYLLRAEILSSVLYKTVEYCWMDRSFGKKIVSSEATEEEILHIRTGTLDQVEAIALLRAFDPGAWVRIAFDLKSVASNLRGEPFVRSVLQTDKPRNSWLPGLSPTWIIAWFPLLWNTLVIFLRRNFSIDVPPD